MRLIIFFTIVFYVFSCNSARLSGEKNYHSKNFNEYLLEIANDTNVYEVPAIRITDPNIYSILDTAIASTEGCKYFDDRIPYLHAFTISSRKKNENIIYSVSSMQSIYNSVGLLLNWLEGIDQPKNVGVFYYKNYLFSVPLGSSRLKKEVEFPFYKKSECFYRITAPHLYKDQTYSSNLFFVKEDNKYKVIDNKICKGVISIR